MALVEQADMKSARGSAYHRFIKRYKVRTERRRAKRDPEVQPTYRRFRGWES